jgi:hypothetical protein
MGAKIHRTIDAIAKPVARRDGAVSVERGLSAATNATLLHRRTGNIAIGAEHATVAGLGLHHNAAGGAVMADLT